jgi:hypothetical protein
MFNSGGANWKDLFLSPGGGEEEDDGAVRGLVEN